MMKRIYLDHNATTSVDPRVLKVMLSELSGPPGNPSSMHWFGQQARQKLAQARETTARFFLAKPSEIIFTSGGTESINLFLRGLPSKGHLITTAIEHSCIYKTVKALESAGLSATYLPVGLWGAPSPESLEASIQSNTQAIILSAANSETGVKIDLQAIAAIADRHRISLLIDAVGYIGKEPLTLFPGITAVACSGHKFHAPKGIGILLSKPTLKLAPLLTGGNQEYQHRAGTENLAGILGLAEAFRILAEEQDSITSHLLNLRMRLETGLKDSLPDLAINGEGPRISNTSNISFPGIDGETLLIQLDMAGIAVSHGSACASGAVEPSRVLLQMGVPRKIACSSVRFSVGRTNTPEEIERAIEIIVTVVKKLSSLGSF